MGTYYDQSLRHLAGDAGAVAALFPNEIEGVPQRETAAWVELSRVLMNMETEGYLRRVPRSDDARYVEVFLTDKGRALFNSLNVVVRRRQNRLLKGFSPQEVAAAFALIRRLSRNMLE